jgi:hypothetical protein
MYPAGSAPPEVDMDIDAFNVSVEGKEESHHIDFTALSRRDVERAIHENIEYPNGTFGIEVRTL